MVNYSDCREGVLSVVYSLWHMNVLLKVLPNVLNVLLNILN